MYVWPVSYIARARTASGATELRDNTHGAADSSIIKNAARDMIHLKSLQLGAIRRPAPPPQPTFNSHVRDKARVKNAQRRLEEDVAARA